jgi:hypothetical protein
MAEWIDVLVDFWHTHDTGNGLPDFLGLSHEDYAKFVEMKAELKIISVPLREDK